MISSSSILLRRLALQRSHGTNALGWQMNTITTEEQDSSHHQPTASSPLEGEEGVYHRDSHIVQEEESIERSNNLTGVVGREYKPNSRYNYDEDFELEERTPLISTNGHLEKSLLPSIDDVLNSRFQNLANVRKENGLRLSLKDSYEFFDATGTRFLYYSLDREERLYFPNVEDLIRFIQKDIKFQTNAKNLDPTFDASDPELPQFWIDCQGFTNDDVDTLRMYFNFEKITATSCYSDHFDASDKWECFEDYFFASLCVREKGDVSYEDNPTEKPNTKSKTLFDLSRYYFHRNKKKQEDKDKRPKPKLYPSIFIHLLLYDRCIITFHEKPFIASEIMLDHLERQYSKIGGRSKLKRVYTGESINNSVDSPHFSHSYASMAISPSTIFHSLLDGFIDRIIPIVDGVVRSCDMIDEYVLSFSSAYAGNTVINDIADFKRKVIILKKLIFPKHRMLIYIVSHHLSTSYFQEEVKIYLRDILDHVSFCTEKLDIAIDSLNESHTNYLTKLQMEVSQAMATTDKFFNRLSAMAIIYAPLAVIVSSFGMNMQVPGQEQNDLYWFFGILCFMGIVTATIIILLRKKFI
ncbi:hypothetical protein C9374_005196 [Naegleria lovaniensis]|uniref:Uncharacterized protein n=1 Tax=Naegleria lovaniensis TaxID=51637 RepID=A0AA88GNY9_NAELO|nr:uncharacterized protein C9374_005196 [Naegleria lovaniensis]KAG2382616.1 hypothetical protein C9374_005196 [Naegleria lovaniensis]